MLKNFKILKNKKSKTSKLKVKILYGREHINIEHKINRGGEFSSQNLTYLFQYDKL